MYDCGILKLCKLTNTAQPGAMPKEQLVQVATAYYTEQTVGVTRSYAARSVNQQIDMLVLCYNCKVAYDCAYAVTEDGTQYAIDMKQKQGDNTLLTLTRLEDFYNVINAE